MGASGFGENLKREREMRGVSLDEISSATRIATRFLEAIENERWDQLPGGVFNRGFVRAVAHYLGLDEENIVAEYVLAVGDRQNVPVWTGSPPVVTPEQPWLAWIVAAVVVIALVAGGWFGARRILAWREARRAARNAAVTASAPPAATEAPGNLVPAASTDNSSQNFPASPDASAEVADPSTASTPQPDTTPAIAPTSPESLPLELKIEAGKKTKVTVEADANRAFEGTMKPGDTHTFTAKERFDVSAHDAGALVLELNGKTLAPIGPTGHSGKTTITRDALRGAPGGGN